MYALLCSKVFVPRGYVDNPLTHLACIIAATVHDVDHRVRARERGGGHDVDNRGAGGAP